MSLDVMVNILARDLTNSAWRSFGRGLQQATSDVETNMAGIRRATDSAFSGLTLGELNAELAVSADAVATLEGNFAAASEAYTAQKTVVQDLQQQYREMATQVSANSLALQQARTDVTSSSAAFGSLNSQLMATQAEYDAVTAAAGKVDAGVLASTGAITAQQGEVATLQATYVEQLATMESYTAAINTTAQGYVELAGSSSAAQQMLATVQARYDALEPAERGQAIALRNQIAELTALSEQYGASASAQQVWLQAQQVSADALAKETAATEALIVKEQNRLDKMLGMSAVQTEVSNTTLAGYARQQEALQALITEQQAQLAPLLASKDAALANRDAMLADYTDSRVAAVALRQEINAETVTEQEFAASVKQTSAELKAQMATQNALSSEFIAQQKADMDATEARLNHMKAVGSVVFGALGVAGLAAFAASVAAASQLDTSVTHLAIDLNVPIDSIKGIKTAIVQMADSGQFSTTQVSDAMAELAKNSFNAGQILYGTGDAAKQYSANVYDAAAATTGLAQETINLAETQGITGVQSADLMSASLKTFAADNMNAATVSNYLSGVLKSGAGDATEVADAIRNSGAQAAMMGVKFSDYATILALMGQNQIRAGQAGTALRDVMVRLLDPTNAQVEAQKNLGLVTVHTGPELDAFKNIVANSGKQGAIAANAFHGTASQLLMLFDAAKKTGAVSTDQTFIQWATQAGFMSSKLMDANGNFIGLKATVELMQEKMKDGGQTAQDFATELASLFTVRGGKGAGILLNMQDFAAQYDATMAKISGSNSASDAAKMNDTLAGSFNRLKTTIISFFAQIGQMSFAQPLKDAMNALNTAIGNIGATLQAHPDMAKRLGDVIIAAMGIGAVGLVASQALPAIMGFMDYMEGLGSLNLGSLISMGDMGWLAGLKTAVHDGILAAFSPSTYSGAFRGMLDAFGALKTNVLGVVDSLMGGIRAFGTGFMAALDQLAMYVANPGMLIEDAFAAMKSGVGFFIDAIQGGFAAAADAFAAGFAAIPELLATAGSALAGILAPFALVVGAILAVAGIITIGVIAFEHFRNKIATFAQMLARDFSPVIVAVKEIFSAFLETVRAKWEQVWPRLEPAVGKFLDALQKLDPVIQFVAKVLEVVLGGAIAVLLTAISGIAGAILTALPDVITFFTAIVHLVADTFAPLVDIVSGKWDKLPGDVSAALGDVKDAATSGFNVIKDTVSGFVTGVSDNVKTTFQDMTTSTDGSFKQADDVAKQRLANMAKTTAGTATLIGDTMDHSGRYIVRTNTDTYKSVEDTTVTTMQTVQDTHAIAVRDITAGFKKLSADGQTYFGALTTTIKASTDDATAYAAKKWDDVVTPIVHNWQVLDNESAKAFHNIKSNISGNFSDAGTNVDATGKAMESDMSGLWNNMNTDSNTGWDSIARGIKDHSGVIHSNTASITNDMEGQLNSMVKDSYGYGSGVVSNLTDGVNSQIPALQDAVGRAKALLDELAGLQAQAGQNSATPSPTPSGGQAPVTTVVVPVNLNGKQIAATVINTMTGQVRQQGAGSISR